MGFGFGSEEERAGGADPREANDGEELEPGLAWLGVGLGLGLGLELGLGLA